MTTWFARPVGGGRPDVDAFRSLLSSSCWQGGASGARGAPSPRTDSARGRSAGRGLLAGCAVLSAPSLSVSRATTVIVGYLISRRDSDRVDWQALRGPRAIANAPESRPTLDPAPSKRSPSFPRFRGNGFGRLSMARKPSTPSSPPFDAAKNYVPFFPVPSFFLHRSIDDALGRASAIVSLPPPGARGVKVASWRMPSAPTDFPTAITGRSRGRVSKSPIPGSGRRPAGRFQINFRKHRKNRCLP